MTVVEVARRSCPRIPRVVPVSSWTCNPQASAEAVHKDRDRKSCYRAQEHAMCSAARVAHAHQNWVIARCVFKYQLRANEYRSGRWARPAQYGVVSVATTTKRSLRSSREHWCGPNTLKVPSCYISTSMFEVEDARPLPNCKDASRCSPLL